MSLFGGKKTYVASTCYNLAGDEAERPDYLKSLVTGAVLTGDAKSSLGDSIRDGYLNGPGLKLRSFYRWAEDHYNDTIGLSSIGLAAAPDVAASLIEAAIGGGASVQSVKFGPADIEVWAEQYMLANHADLFESAWTSDYDAGTNQVVITLPGGATESFAPAGFDKSALYLQATYNLVSSSSTGAVVAGPVINLDPGDSFPPTSGWTTDSFSSTPHATPEPWTETHGVYSETVYMGDDGTGRIYSIKSIMHQDQTGHDDGAGHVVLDRSVQTDTQEITHLAYSPLRIFIYKLGSGNAALDAQVSAAPMVGGFFPPIPVRLDNHFLSESYLPAQYEAASKAYKRLMGRGKFDELVDKLADNENLADIDYAFIVPGISLNVVENSGRKYIYQFFANAMTTALYGEADYGPWGAGIGAAQDDMNVWQAWLAAQGNPGNPLDGTPEPTRGVYQTAARNEISVKANASGIGYDTRISWQSIKEETGSGLAKAGAKVGEVWLSKGGSFQEIGTVYGGSLGTLSSSDSTAEDLLVFWQDGANHWRKLTIRGLVHQNFVYKGKYVEIKAHEALDDEDESGFIIPIHYETWTAMSLRDTTQMTTACIFLVLNSYKVKKQKWYQTGIFKIFLVVAMIVLTFYFPPAGLVGASFTTVATVVLTNIVLSTILFKIVSAVAIELFGKKFGTLVAIVATFLVMNPTTFLDASGSFNLANLARADNLIRLTTAVGRGVQAVTQIDVMNTLQKTQGILEDYAKQSKEISDMFTENLGNGKTLFDPTALTDASNPFAFAVEPESVFLTRTLMTGSDIAELSLSLLSDFTSLTLNMELPV